MTGFLHDVRIGVRGLRGSAGFAAVAVVSLALGIGANTAIFSVVDAVLLRPLPYRAPERIVVLWENNFSRHRDHNVIRVHRQLPAGAPRDPDRPHRGFATGVI